MILILLALTVSIPKKSTGRGEGLPGIGEGGYYEYASVDPLKGSTILCHTKENLRLICLVPLKNDQLHPIKRVCFELRWE